MPETRIYMLLWKHTNGMKKNVGTVDRGIRIIVGLALLSFIMFFRSEYRWFGLIGFFPLITGVIGFCPVYARLDMNTCKRK